MTAVCAVCWCATEDALGHSKNSSSNWLILSKSSYFLLVNSCFSLLLLLLKSVNILLYCGERESSKYSLKTTYCDYCVQSVTRF
jgi:hypothetical protein